MKNLFLIIAFSCCSFCFAQEQSNVSLNQLDGSIINSKDILANGKQKLILFWADYCRTCKLEMKGIRNVGGNWLTDYNAEVYIIAVMNYPSDVYTKIPFLEEMKREGLYFLYDDNMSFYKQYQTDTLPLTVILDGDGNLKNRWNTYDDGLESSIGMYLKKYHEQDQTLAEQ